MYRVLQDHVEQCLQLDVEQIAVRRQDDIVRRDNVERRRDGRRLRGQIGEDFRSGARRSGVKWFLKVREDE